MAVQAAVRNPGVRELQSQLAYRQALQEVANEINAAQNLDEILIDLKDRTLSLFQADRLTIYVVDGVNKEIFAFQGWGGASRDSGPHQHLQHRGLCGFKREDDQYLQRA